MFKHGRVWISLWIMGLSTLVGCESMKQGLGRMDSPAPNDPFRPGTSANDVQKKFDEAFGSLKGYAFSKKQEYITQANQQLADYGRQIEQMRAQARMTAGQAKTDIENQVRVLEAKQKAALDSLERVKGASVTAWEEVKASMSTAMADLEKGKQQAQSTLQSVSARPAATAPDVSPLRNAMPTPASELPAFPASSGP